MYLHLTFETKLLTHFVPYGKQKFDYGLISASTESKKTNPNKMKLQEKPLYSVIISHSLWKTGNGQKIKATFLAP